MKIRTDLAVEANELWAESAEETTKLEGVESWDEDVDGVKVTVVKISSERGSQALGKPLGSYITLELNNMVRREETGFIRAASAMAEKLRGILSLEKSRPVLVVGLGNEAITPDAVGPKALESLMVTRHLVSGAPEYFSYLRPVSALSPGVLGTTGLESAEIVRGVVARSKPEAVIVIDALASRRLSRVCSTIQLADSGIVPGSGVGNARSAFNRETLGVPVIAIGVPTVVDAATLASDLLEQAGQAADYTALRPFGEGMIVTPKDIDRNIKDMAKVLGYGINLALHPELEIEDVTSFIS